MTDSKTRLHVASKKATDNGDDSGLRELAKEICDRMSEYDNYLQDTLLTLSWSRRERRRMEKAERQARMKERKNVKRKDAEG